MLDGSKAKEPPAKAQKVLKRPAASASVQSGQETDKKPAIPDSAVPVPVYRNLRMPIDCWFPSGSEPSEEGSEVEEENDAARIRPAAGAVALEGYKTGWRSGRAWCRQEGASTYEYSKDISVEGEFITAKAGTLKLDGVCADDWDNLATATRPKSERYFEGTFEGETLSVYTRKGKVTKKNETGLLMCLWISGRQVAQIMIRKQSKFNFYKDVAVQLAEDLVAGRVEFDKLKPEANRRSAVVDAMEVDSD